MLRTRTASNWRSISPFNARPIIPGSRSIRNGSIGARTDRVRYAENPPKKYEDIVNVDFYATQRYSRPVARVARHRAVLGE